jgi:hypothetical protein
MTIKQVTLATLQQSTEQEIFDWVVSNLMKQGKQSLEKGVCKYKTDGLKCAAGWLIDDSEHLTRMDNLALMGGSGWSTLVSQQLVPSAHFRFIKDLQRIHDAGEVEEWPERFRSLATHYKLNSSIISQFV